MRMSLTVFVATTLLSAGISYAGEPIKLICSFGEVANSVDVVIDEAAQTMNFDGSELDILYKSPNYIVGGMVKETGVVAHLVVSRLSGSFAFSMAAPCPIDTCAFSNADGSHTDVFEMAGRGTCSTPKF